jgi:hypothetical protein
MLKKKIRPIFERIIELFTEKIVTKLSKIWVWNPRSGKTLFRILDPGVKKAPDPRSATLSTITNDAPIFPFYSKRDLIVEKAHANSIFPVMDLHGGYRYW